MEKITKEPESLKTFDPDSFETNFWKDAEVRAGWDDLEPGRIEPAYRGSAAFMIPQKKLP